MEKVTLWIVLMACVTFMMRYAFFMRYVPIKLNRHARQFLLFTAPCVLTAMWSPIVFNDAVASIDLLNPYLLAGIFCIVTSLLIRQTLIVILLSMLMFYFLRLIL